MNVSNLFPKEKNVRRRSAERPRPRRGPADPTTARGHTQAWASHPAGDLTAGGRQASAAALQRDLPRLPRHELVLGPSPSRPNLGLGEGDEVSCKLGARVPVCVFLGLRFLFLAGEEMSGQLSSGSRTWDSLSSPPLRL